MRLPTYFISHGGGPWPYMDDLRARMHILEASLVDIPRQLPQEPKALLMISAHWEETDFRVMSNPQPPMVYDYGGFPAHTYKVSYPAPGSPVLAERVMALLTAAGLPTQADANRGFDHGTFAPLAVMYPEAQMPVVQVSLKTGLDPEQHLALGRALAPLRDEGVLIIGSGLSYHNLRYFGPQAKEPSSQFDHWLQQTLLESTPEDRVEHLINWAKAPAARIAHPREDHLLPLMVAVGAAQNEAGACVYHEENMFGGVVASSFRFGAIK
ncbi:DODA-type extradiol aromatic ring-opening family dioxygenase [Undibacterium sp. Ji50W]|uniref:DODA-type extradiol aromatic ring-opening family dioxygenase n=1 Tax=Undibacterium sp. Ji50W TaxID=3413041 RepID=UPI003BF00754